MAIMTIDVGIRHLGIIVMERQGNNYNILLWEVYDTSESISINCCQGITKAGKTCKFRGIYKCNQNYFCKTHSKNQGTAILIKKKLVQQMPLPEIAIGLLNCVENLYENHSDIMNKVKKIGIELQLAKNPKMKFASNCILTKFVDIYRIRGETIPISFMRASMKLKLFYDGPIINYTVKNAYSRRKQCAIVYTRYFLKKLEFDISWSIKFEESSVKRDDLADVFCYALILLGYKRRQGIKRNYNS